MKNVIEPYTNSKLIGWSNRSILELLVDADCAMAKYVGSIKGIATVSLICSAMTVGILMHDKIKSNSKNRD